MDIKTKSKIYGMIADARGEIREMEEHLIKLETYIINLED